MIDENNFKTIRRKDGLGEQGCFKGQYIKRIERFIEQLSMYQVSMLIKQKLTSNDVISHDTQVFVIQALILLFRY